jgi:hypothetical protein
MPAGFSALEVGVVYAQGSGGPLALPEILLRIKRGSPCETVAERLIPFAQASRGRTQNELAILFSPRFPTVRMTARLVVSIVRALSIPAPVRAEKSGATRARALGHAA